MSRPDDEVGQIQNSVVGDAEAFGAYDMRKGNLVSCKSQWRSRRAMRAAGKFWGVDVAEQSAAKATLENAVDQLAERVLPKLVQ